MAVVYAGELEGTWTGREDTGEPVVFAFTDTAWSYTNETGVEWARGTYTFNENAAPRQLDLTISAASDNQWITRTALTIYNIEGNRMTLSGAEPGSGERPADFSGDGNTRTFILFNDDLPAEDEAEDSRHSDKEDNLKVYVNCFITTLGGRP